MKIIVLMGSLHTAELWITHNGNVRSHSDGNQGTIISEVESHLAG